VSVTTKLLLPCFTQRNRTHLKLLASGAPKLGFRQSLAPIPRRSGAHSTGIGRKLRKPKFRCVTTIHYGYTAHAGMHTAHKHGGGAGGGCCGPRTKYAASCSFIRSSGNGSNASTWRTMVPIIAPTPCSQSFWFVKFALTQDAVCKSALWQALLSPSTAWRGGVVASGGGNRHAGRAHAHFVQIVMIVQPVLDFILFLRPRDMGLAGNPHRHPLQAPFCKHASEQKFETNLKLIIDHAPG
jgi:hypothetical protein